MMLAGSAMTVYAQTGWGILDSVQEDAITGWGWDSSAPDTPVEVAVTITDRETKASVKEIKVMADTYREDLKTSGIGNGSHGFRIEMDWSDLPDGIYTVKGQVNGHALNNEKTYAKGTEAQEQLNAEKASNPAASGNLRSLGMFRTTGYCPCYGCSEGWGRKTSTGAIAVSNHTIAVDPRVIPYGSRVMIDGVIYTAEDRGGGVRGHHIDIFFDTHAQTRQHGSRMQEIFLVV